MNRHSSSPHIQNAAAPDNAISVKPTAIIAASELRMTVFEPTRSSSSPPSTAPAAATTFAAHAEQQHVRHGDAVDIHAQHRAEGEHAGQPVAEHRAGEQVVDDVSVSPPLGDQVRPQLAVGAEHTDRRPRLRFEVGRRRCDEHRQRERGHPCGGEQHGRAHVLAVGRRDVQQSDRWTVARGESPVDHKKQHHAADIACGPTESGHTTGVSPVSSADAASRCKGRWPGRCTPR